MCNRSCKCCICWCKTYNLCVCNRVLTIFYHTHHSALWTKQVMWSVWSTRLCSMLNSWFTDVAFFSGF
jgi:spore maturation protein CgeB